MAGEKDSQTDPNGWTPELLKQRRRRALIGGGELRTDDARALVGAQPLRDESWAHQEFNPPLGFPNGVGAPMPVESISGVAVEI